MAEEQIKHVTLVGGGLVGALLAIRLARAGQTVELFERREDLRKTRKEEGRSINLAISVRGLHALKQVGLEKEALAIAIPMRGRMVHPLGGQANLQPYSQNQSECIHSISRSGLNALLLDAAEKTGKVKIHFGQRVEEVDLEKREVGIVDVASGLTNHVKYRRLFGTDGCSSSVRQAILRAKASTEHHSILDHGYKELLLPAGPADSHLMTKEALHIWPRETFMLIALPNLNGSFTCTLFLPFKGATSFEKLETAGAVEKFFDEQFPDMAAILDVDAEYDAHPVGTMTTVKSPHWYYKDEVCLLGDAAHAIVPFFGQGMNCGFEDVTVLMELLQPNDWGGTFQKFQSARKTNTDAIADMAVENFVEMRDKVADPKFLREKAMEKKLQERFPGKYVNRYQLVTFTRLPYRYAYEIGEIEAEILKTTQDLDEAEKRVEKEVLPRLEQLGVKNLRGF
jgi:kynurenine 3-monooxygenase